MSRGRNLALTLLMLALVAASALAFVRTQTLKVERPQVRLIGEPGTIRPGCRCPSGQAELTLALRARLPVDVRVVPADDLDSPVAVLARDATLGPGRARLRWDGSDESGRPVPGGDYRLRVELPALERAYTFADRITVTPAGGPGDRARP